MYLLHRELVRRHDPRPRRVNKVESQLFVNTKGRQADVNRVTHTIQERRHLCSM